ncbi:MAG: HAD hydrolase-like protein [Tissierellaceae bacterium]|nr:HAD hydrolase-like protein [Tissierellaceae bacterium]
MKETLSEFRKSKEFLVCVDSDGCAMDTMNIKHEKCFAPEAIKEWGLQDIETEFKKNWNRINLYSKTRGINRFKGLVKTFESLSTNNVNVPDFSSILEWTETSPELSNPALEKVISKTKDKQLIKALSWSKAVNKAISELPEDDKPFVSVREGLEAISAVADVVIVSSANASALKSEWTRHELSKYVQVMLGQEAGSKAYCIGVLKENSYLNHKVLMVGDAPGDLEAAKKNDVLYYPILVGKEDFSWERLASEALQKFLNGTYMGEYQKKLIDEFNNNLK